MVVTRSSVRPVFSAAAIVFSKVGGSGLLAIRSVSVSCSDIAASSAGLNRAICTRSNGGTPPYRPSQLASSGFGSATFESVAGPLGLRAVLGMPDSALRESSLLAFTPAVPALSATAMAIIAGAQSSTKLRVINSRIEFIVLCLEVHDAFIRWREKLFAQ